MQVKVNQLKTVNYYLVTTKPRIWGLLAYSSLAGFFLGKPGLERLAEGIMAVVAVMLGAAGAEAVAGYLEKDIDSIMSRTRLRPIPSGKVRPVNVLAVGLTLLFLSFLVSYSINPLALLLISLGIIDYLLIYIVLSKRRTSLSVMLGSFSGGAPVLVGYSAALSTISFDAVMLSLIIIIWTPCHVWSLTLRYKEDYLRAGIPILPNVVGDALTAKMISVATILLATFSIVLPILSSTMRGLSYVVPVTIAGTLIIYEAVKLQLSLSPKQAWRLFKLSSPYLTIVLTSVIVTSMF